MPDVLTRVDEDGATMEFDAVGAHRYHSEHQRLEREVIRCAKLFTAIKDSALDATWVDRTALADNDLDVAVRKLLAFEAEQKIGVE